MSSFVGFPALLPARALRTTSSLSEANQRLGAWSRDPLGSRPSCRCQGRCAGTKSGRLDGFYTFLVGTADGFAVLRDPIACKPAVLAETDDWVAMASEYRAIAVLPGAEDARVWEPSPGVVYAWERVAA